MTSSEIKYGDKCPDCGSTFLPETPCDFGYCKDLINENDQKLPNISSMEFLRET